MTFEPVLPGPILAVVAAALIIARLVTLRPVLITIGPHRRAAALRWSGLTLAVLLVLAALARPGTGTGEPDAASAGSTGGPNVFFVVDRSVDTAATDYDGRPRFDGIRADIETLIERHPSARFAVISFAARPALDWPLSDDAYSLDPLVAAMAPYPGTPDAVAQIDAGAAANPLRYQLIQAAQQYPQSDNLVYYLGCGAGDSAAPQGRFDSATATIDGGAVLGYGTPGGVPPIAADTLRDIAGQLGVTYVPRAAGRPLDTLLPERATGVAAQSNSPRTEWYWLLAGLAAVLVLAEIFLTVRELRRNRTARRAVSS